MMNRIHFFVTALLAGATLLAAGGAHAQPHGTTQVENVVTPTASPDVWLRRLVGRYRFEGEVEVVASGYGCASLPPDPAQVADPPPPEVPYCKTIKGVGDCIAIGTGPGVQCVLNVAWDDLYEVVYPKELKPGARPEPTGVFNLPGGVSNLAPAMMLYGLDPGKSAINYLLVDNKGLPEGGLGFIAGDRATFKTPCVNAAPLLNGMKPPPQPPQPPDYRAQPRTCDRTIRIDASPDAKILYMWIDIEINDEMFTRFTLSLHRVPQDDQALEAQKAPAAQR